MAIEDRSRAMRKLAQVGYYRLSGFWYPCREICFDEHGKAIKVSENSKKLTRSDHFINGTSFDSIFALYLFDKRLRLLLLDALERVEVYLRAVIAHELGELNPLAYRDSSFILDKYKRPNASSQAESSWDKFLNKQELLINKSKEDCIAWHKKRNMEIPFWVVIETWDFGMLNWYYKMLSLEHKRKVYNRIDSKLDNTLEHWLETLNTLRNKCAHHARTWNINIPNDVKLIDDDHFNRVGLDSKSKQRILGCLSILWYLLLKIGPNSRWIYKIAELLNTIPTAPNCSLLTMGCADPHRFPLDLFVSNQPK